MRAKVRCPFCGIWDEIQVGLSFSVGSRCTNSCHNCKREFLVLYTSQGFLSARLELAIMKDGTPEEKERHVLKREIEVREIHGLLREQEWVQDKELFGEEIAGLEDREPEEDELRCVCCKQAIRIPYSRRIRTSLQKRSPLVILTSCPVCSNDIGVVFTGDLFPEDVVSSIKIDWRELFWEEGEDIAMDLVIAHVKGKFDIPETAEIRIFHDEISDQPDEDDDSSDSDEVPDPGDFEEDEGEEDDEEGTGVPTIEHGVITDQDQKEFLEGLGQLDKSDWWDQGGPDNPAHH